MSMHPFGRVLAIATKLREGGPLIETDAVTAEVGGGLRGDVKCAPDRGVTLLSARQWRQVAAELQADLAWRLRRANILLEADSLAPLIGRTIALGEVHLLIRDETRPCGLMDAQHPGLRAALKPECRGGVHGRVLRGGWIRVGDLLSVIDALPNE